MSLAGRSFLKQSSSRILKIVRMGRIGEAEHTRREAEALMQREAQQLDDLFFTHRRNLARKNPEAYMKTLCEDDRRLKAWANDRIERHLWVEAT